MKIWNSSTWGIILWPLSELYKCVMMLRNRLYDLRKLSSVRLKTKVISIGNLTVGGTGKTPLVERLAGFLRDKGYKVAVLSRGYKRKEKKAVLVSDGKEIKVSPEEAGDEPFLVATHLSNVSVLVGQDRVKTGRLAVRTQRCDFLIMDDAFQHRRVKRDLDIIVLDSTNPWGNGRLLPAGPLREPLSSLSRADVIVFARVDEVSGVEENVFQVRKFTHAPILFASHRPVEWVSLKNEKTFPLEFLKEKKVLGFAGIGNPASFRKTLEKVGVEIAYFFRFRDHHWYKKRDLERIIQKAKEIEADAVVTTEKDGIKVSRAKMDDIPIYFLKIEFEIQEGVEEIKRLLDNVLVS